MRSSKGEGETVRQNQVQGQDMEYRSSSSSVTNRNIINTPLHLLTANSTQSDSSSEIPITFVQRPLQKCVPPPPPLISKPNISPTAKIINVREKVRSLEIRSSDCQQNHSAFSASSQPNKLVDKAKLKPNEHLQQPTPNPPNPNHHVARNIAAIIKNALRKAPQQQRTPTGDFPPPCRDVPNLLSVPLVEKVVEQAQSKRSPLPMSPFLPNQLSTPIKKLSLLQPSPILPLPAIITQNISRLQNINQLKINSNRSAPQKQNPNAPSCSVSLTIPSTDSVQKPPIPAKQLPHSSIPQVQNAAIPPQNVFYGCQIRDVNQPLKLSLKSVTLKSPQFSKPLQRPSLESTLPVTLVKPSTLEQIHKSVDVNSNLASDKNTVTPLKLSLKSVTLKSPQFGKPLQRPSLESTLPVTLVKSSTLEQIHKSVDVNSNLASDKNTVTPVIPSEIPLRLSYKDALLKNVNDNGENMEIDINDDENDEGSGGNGSETNSFIVSQENLDSNAHFPFLHEVPESTKYGCIKDWVEDRDQNWRANLPTLQDRLLTMRESAKYQKDLDAKFEVGPNKTIVSAHRSVLCLKSTYFQDLFSKNESRVFPDIDPVGLSEVFRHMYTGQFNVDEGPPEKIILKVLAIFNAANKCEYDELACKCQAYLRSHLSYKNVAHLYNHAFTSNDQRLMELAISEFCGDPIKVFTSEGFLSLTEAALCCMLENDKWACGEREVFEAVKRWAIEKFNKETQRIPNGEELCKAMGQTRFLIRFKSLSKEEFENIIIENPKLFSDVEDFSFMKYFRRNSEIYPKEFTSKVRGKDPSDNHAFVRNQNIIEKMEIEPEIYIANDIFEENLSDQEMDVGIEEQRVKPNCPEPNCSEPPQKKRKTKKSLGVPSPGTASNHEASNKEETLQEVLNTVDTERKVIDAILTVLPNSRVYLPNLTDFHLIIKRNKVSNGSTFRSGLKSKLISLRHILCFNKQENGTAASVFQDLMEHKVNVTVRVTGVEVVVLNINHQEGSLVINLLKDAQEIINQSHGMQLKKLAVNECDLTSLEPVSKDRLEMIVIRRVKGLKGREEFLQSCAKLREVCWHGMNNELLNLTEFLKRNPLMKKLSVSRCKFTLETCLDDVETTTLSTVQNYLEELYMDNCDWQEDFIERLPSVFPYVRRIQIYGSKCDALVCFYVLKMPSVEWIFLWEMAWRYQKIGRKWVHVEQSEKMNEFLTPLLNIWKKEKLTFILEKKKQSEVMPGTSESMIQQEDNLLYRDAWSGKNYNVKERFELISKIDYTNFDYDEFYLNYDDYWWSETTESNKKKAKQSTSVLAAGNSIINEG